MGFLRLSSDSVITLKGGYGDRWKYAVVRF